MPQAVTACSTLEDVECTQCGVEMSSHVGSSGQIRYFHCPSCSRWTTSMYSEVLRADTKMRARRSTSPAPSLRSAAPSEGSVKERLEQWLRSLSGNDPYVTLGVSPSISDGGLRERFLSLARHHHPDRGGTGDAMRTINEAYEQALAQRERSRMAQRPQVVPLVSR